MNMQTLFEKLDGSGKPPREEQLQYLSHLSREWPRANYHVLYGPPGMGKSFIAMTVINNIANSAIIAPNNALVDQYIRDYPELNSLKGKDYYSTEEKYIEAKNNLKAGQPTVFNPLSYYYYYIGKPEQRPTTVVIDEAHKLEDLLMLTVGQELPCGQYGIPPDMTEAETIEWLGQVKYKAKKIFTLTNPTKRQIRLINKFEKLCLLADYLRDYHHEVSVTFEVRKDSRGVFRKCLCVQPLEFPAGLVKTIFGASTRIILMSGTIDQLTIDSLLPSERVDYKQYDSFVNIDQTPIEYVPIPYPQRRNIATQAQYAYEVFRQQGQPNTLIHLSYAAQTEFAKVLKQLDPKIKIHTNTKHDKMEIIKQFKSQGGILLGAGMAEGIDLPHNDCRLVIIPRLLYPNKGDPRVQKRLNFKNGSLWYSLETLRTTIQQIGRGVRGPTDKCRTVVFDVTFPKLYKQTREYIPPSFTKRLKGLPNE